MPDATVTDVTETGITLDALPEHVLLSMEQRDRWAQAVQSNHDGLEAVIDNLRLWNPGSTLRVAFLGGSPTLHHRIATVVAEIEEACTIQFDFGRNAQTQTYRSWTEGDEVYRAEIRVSFDKPGNFSLVGRDSVDPDVGDPDRRVGGRAHQASLNLGGFDEALPHRWRGTVLHEFLHALGVHHEHVNPNGPCQDDFRWHDDPGYLPTKKNGVFVPDGAGRRPGIYTYLSGAPNFWSKAKVDHNLRPSGATTSGTFDRESVMLYRFPRSFYKSPTSTCRPSGMGMSLSDGDKEGLRKIYGDAPIASEDQFGAALEVIRTFEGLSDGPESDSVEDRMARASEPGRWAMGAIMSRGL